MVLFKVGTTKQRLGETSTTLISKAIRPRVFSRVSTPKHQPSAILMVLEQCNLRNSHHGACWLLPKDSLEICSHSVIFGLLTKETTCSIQHQLQRWMPRGKIGWVAHRPLHLAAINSITRILSNNGLMRLASALMLFRTAEMVVQPHPSRKTFWIRPCSPQISNSLRPSAQDRRQHRQLIRSRTLQLLLPTHRYCRSSR